MFGDPVDKPSQDSRWRHPAPKSDRQPRQLERTETPTNSGGPRINEPPSVWLEMFSLSKPVCWERPGEGAERTSAKPRRRGWPSRHWFGTSLVRASN